MGMDQWERDYSSSDKQICRDCVTEPIIQLAIDENAYEDETCSFCGKQPAAEFDCILECINEAIAADYTDPANELPYESREGGYQGSVIDGDDLVNDLDTWTNRDDVREEAAACFAGSFWCEQDYFSLKPYDTLKYGWEGFSEQIKHVTRYLFLRHDPSVEERHDEIPPSRMLAALGGLLQEHATFTTLAPGTPVFRARVHDENESLSTPLELGPPPAETAKMSNRMSPAGVPMFYGALDENTAVLETLDWNRTKGVALTVGGFTPARPLVLLDLVSEVDIPSIFDPDNRHMRPYVVFLRDFSRELAKPVSRDGYEHVEYVPTQVVTEYVRYELKGPNEEQIDGIMYRSSRNRGLTSLVLFVDSDGCGPKPEPRTWSSKEMLMVLIDCRRYAPSEFSHLK